MSKLFATAGMKIFIGEVKTFSGTDFIESDFTTGTPTWTEIGGTTNLGSTGATNAWCWICMSGKRNPALRA